MPTFTLCRLGLSVHFVSLLLFIFTTVHKFLILSQSKPQLSLSSLPSRSMSLTLHKHIQLHRPIYINLSSLPLSRVYCATVLDILLLYLSFVVNLINPDPFHIHRSYPSSSPSPSLKQQHHPLVFLSSRSINPLLHRLFILTIAHSFIFFFIPH